MERKRYAREFKLEAVRLVKERGVSVAQASRDLGVHANVLREWVRAFAADPEQAFPGRGADNGVVCSMSRSGNVWDNAAMESFFSSLKTERTARKLYRTRDEARADVFDYIERFYNPKRRHSTIGYLSPMEFEQRAGFA